ncbi:MAG: cytochrome-c oxidase, cbb3-type subunit III, partial [Panacagrimonas sp.]
LNSQSVRRAAGDPQTTGHQWDGDLAEYNNPLPRWWSWLFYITIVFALAYLVLYPGLGSWKGTLGWSQVGQLHEEQQAAEKQYGPLYEKFAAAELDALRKNPEALAIGQKLFLNNCAQCHASDGGGSRGFPNLTAGAWQWGGDVKTVKATITEGRSGVMPAFGAALGEQGVKNVAQYVRSLSGLTADSLRVAFGKEIYAQNCVACHGADGKGNVALGAPNLADKNWLYGSAEATVMETIAGGRSNQMPAHKALLDEARIHLLTAYVLSLSQGAAK